MRIIMRRLQLKNSSTASLEQTIYWLLWDTIRGELFCKMRTAVDSENYNPIISFRNSIDLSKDMFVGVLSVNSSLILLPLS